jgi:tetratricopeptide (TPR) repeat protein
MNSRWEDAARCFNVAHELQPSSTEFEQDLLFSQAKVHLAVGQPEQAADALRRGLPLAEAAWRPHFARELANAAGLAGDFAAAAGHYESALSLGAVSNRAAIGEALSALAAHHEPKDVAVAKRMQGFLRLGCAKMSACSRVDA